MKNVRGKRTWMFRVILGLSVAGSALLFLSGCWPLNVAPVASFTASTLMGTTPLTVTFSAATSHDPDGIIPAYEWDYDNGAFDRGEEVTHTFVTEGSYTVTLTVMDNRGALATSQETITVRAAPNDEPETDDDECSCGGYFCAADTCDEDICGGIACGGTPCDGEWTCR